MKKTHKTKVPVKKSAAKTSKAIASSAKARQVKLAKYKSFKMSKRIRSQDKPLPSSMKIVRRSISLMRNNWKLFLGIVVIYSVMNLVLVQSFTGGQKISDLKIAIQDVPTDKPGAVSTAASLFSYLLATANGSTSEGGKIYQVFIVIVLSLIIIWSLRQISSGRKLGIKEAFYNGTYALIPFVLVMFIVGLQLLPLIVGTWLFGAIFGSGIAVTFVEQSVIVLLTFLFVVLSLYMVTSSLFALYIVTLPDMTPMRALRSSRALVLHRRWQVLRKVLFLPVLLLIISGGIMTPFLFFLPVAAEAVFFIITMSVPLAVHTYMYSLYRSLL